MLKAGIHAALPVVFYVKNFRKIRKKLWEKIYIQKKCVPPSVLQYCSNEKEKKGIKSKSIAKYSKNKNKNKNENQAQLNKKNDSSNFDHTLITRTIPVEKEGKKIRAEKKKKKKSNTKKRKKGKNIKSWQNFSTRTHDAC